MNANNLINLERKKLDAKLEVHYNKLVQAEHSRDKEEIERHLRMIEVYRAEIVALDSMTRPVKTGVL
jgi:hypothetical protein